MIGHGNLVFNKFPGHANAAGLEISFQSHCFSTIIRKNFQPSPKLRSTITFGKQNVIYQNRPKNLTTVYSRNQQNMCPVDMRVYDGGGAGRKGFTGTLL